MSCHMFLGISKIVKILFFVFINLKSVSQNNNWITNPEWFWSSEWFLTPFDLAFMFWLCMNSGTMWFQCLFVRFSFITMWALFRRLAMYFFVRTKYVSVLHPFTTNITLYFCQLPVNMCRFMLSQKASTSKLFTTSFALYWVYIDRLLFLVYHCYMQFQAAVWKPS